MSESNPSKSTQLAELLDRKFTIPGTEIRFGVDPVLGLIPGLGDWVSGLASLYYMFHASVKNAETAVLLRMFFNIMVDIGIGSIPILGEIFDVFWKSNMRNAKLLEELRENPQKTENRSRWFLWIVFTLLAILVILSLVAVGWLLLALFDFIFQSLS